MSGERLEVIEETGEFGVRLGDFPLGERGRWFAGLKPCEADVDISVSLSSLTTARPGRLGLGLRRALIALKALFLEEGMTGRSPS